MEQLLENLILVVQEQKQLQKSEKDILISEIIRLYAQCDQAFFLSQLRAITEEDHAIYTLLSSALYAITKDPVILDTLELLLIENKDDIFFLEAVSQQIKSLRFDYLETKNSYSKARTLSDSLANRCVTTFFPDCTYQPFSKRNQKRIIVATDTLLGVKHAPTKIVLDLCYQLIQDGDYEVFLLIQGTEHNRSYLESFWYNPRVANYNEELNGSFRFVYKDILIPGYQFYFCKNNVKDLFIAKAILQEWNPLCVFYVGGDSFRHDWYRFFTTELSMPCVDGYNISCAQSLISYVKSTSTYIEESEKFINSTGQLRFDLNFIGRLRPENLITVQREDFLLPKDAFVIAIVGNRLNDEMSQNFKNLIEELLTEQPLLYLAFIGNCSPLSTSFPDRIRYLGYQEHLVDTLKIMDLFLNPPRQGGGGGAECALQAGIPIATCADGDVATYVDAGSICETLTDLKVLVIKYMTNKTFFQKQQHISYLWKEKKLSAQNNLRYVDLLQKIVENLDQGLL